MYSNIVAHSILYSYTYTTILSIFNNNSIILKIFSNTKNTTINIILTEQVDKQNQAVLCEIMYVVNVVEFRKLRVSKRVV